MSATVATNQLPDTKRKLLEAAMQLMILQGFNATTVDQVCAEAKLTKGSFFHYFKSKDEIGLEAVELFHARQNARFAEAPFNRLADPLQKLHGLLDHLCENTRSSDKVQGCLMGSLTQELAHTHPKIRSSCEEKFNGFARLIQTWLQEARTKHRPRADFDAASVATMFVSLMQGSMLLAKARQDASVLRENLEHFRSYVQTLFGPPGRS